jgi:putative membrane protein
MQIVSIILVTLVAFLHFYFLALEMFFWKKPLGLRVFNQSLEDAKKSAVLAANQGLYNGFLAVGLVWGLFDGDPVFSKQIKIFFLLCVAVAGAFGGLTVNKRIFFIQSIPALLALAFLFYV